MKERPILFSAPMVRAIFEGRKTMTRRVVKWPGVKHWTTPSFVNVGGGQGGQDGGHWTNCPYGTVGDRLWVRESNLFVSECGKYLCRKNFSTKDNAGFLENYEVWTRDKKTHWVGDDRINQEEDWYVGLKALPYVVTSWSCQMTGQKKGSFTLGLTHYDPETLLVKYATPEIESRKVVFRKRVPGIHMPRWASRITLEVAAIRVERLNAISRGDAMSEGCPFPNMAEGEDPRLWFADLWTTINGRESWDANPWVWVVEFRRVTQ